MEIKLKNNKTISIKGRDVMSLLLETSNILVEEVYDNNKIVELIIDNCYMIRLYDKIEVEYIDKNSEVYKTHYIINYIQKDTNSYKLYEFIENEEVQFCMPALVSLKETNKWSTNTYLTNVFLENNLEIWKNEKNIIFLQYRFFPFESYETLDKFLKSRVNFISVIPNGRFNIYVFKIPDEYLKDINSYRLGKYNEISEDYKNKIVTMFNLKKGNSTYDLFYNLQLLRDKLSIELGVEIPSNICPKSKPKLVIYNEYR